MISIDLSERTPPYVQIRAAVLAAIARGELAEHDRLPTVRQLAGDLGVAPGTVQRAYSELEADGALESHGRRGTFVAARAARSDARPGSIGTAAQRFVVEAERLGVGALDALDAVAAALANRSVG